MNRIIAGLTMTGMALTLFPSCEGILSGLYDVPEKTSEYGFVQTETQTGHGKIYINVSQYTYWTYLDFDQAAADSVDIASGAPAPEGWDLAVHRWDPKTNGGAVARTSYTDIEDFIDSGTMPSDDAFVEDIWTEDVIAIDMSGMMQGNILYTEDYYNPELAKWLNVDTSTMPPIYTRSDNVFVLRLSDGRHVALKLESIVDSSGTRGYLTIQYKTMEEKK